MHGHALTILSLYSMALLYALGMSPIHYDIAGKAIGFYYRLIKNLQPLIDGVALSSDNDLINRRF